jgi:hypothetical protein
LGLLACLLLPAIKAAETRIWTSRKGSTIEAELLRFDETTALLLAAGNKQIPLPMADLSIADRQYLVESVGADPKILVSGEVGEPEKQVRIDSSTFKKLKESNLTLGTESESDYDLLESEHFLIATAGGVRAQAMAETAERMWHGMAFQHMNFRRDWGDKKMMIMLVEKDEAYAALGKWYIAYLKEKGQGEAAGQASALWDKASARTIVIPEEMAEKHNVFQEVNIFRVTPENSPYFKKSMGPFQIHSVAGALLERQMGNVGSYGVEGHFAVSRGHSYYKEISLTGKSETNLVSASGSNKDVIEEKKSFGEASNWARTLRSLVKKGEMKCDLTTMFALKSDAVKADDLALMYSFSSYMQSTPPRMAAYAAMVRRIESSKQIPVPVEIAKIFGFDSLEAFEADWKLYITEGKFK